MLVFRTVLLGAIKKMATSRNGVYCTVSAVFQLKSATEALNSLG